MKRAPLLTAVLIVASAMSLPAAPPAGGLADATSTTKAILDKLEADGDFDAAVKAADELFDHVVLTVRATAAGPLKEAAFTRRLVRQLQQADPSTRVDLLKLLRKSPNLSAALVFLVKEPADKPEQVYGVLQELRAKHEPKLEEYANLTAALCVVHDQKLVHRINENKTEAIDVAELFEFYTANDKKMLFGVKVMPPELQVFVVDNAVSRAEMDWALGKYARNKNVGALFNEIQYDHESVRGAVKKSTAAGWGLMNILKHGGVCADQAYFAVSVGKSIGVPTTYTTARSGEVGHAWVGFLQDRGGKGVWNFDNGRFGDYQSIRGNIDDPQTRRKIPDSYVGVLAEMIGAKALDRHTAVALVDAAQRITDEQSPIKPAAETRAVRPVKNESAEEFIDAAAKLAPGYPDAWFVIRDLAQADALTLTKKRAWVQRLDKIAGGKYPDFYLAIVKPMIASIKDTAQQNTLWEGAYRLMITRLDLAAEIRVAQGEMWLAAGDVKRAGMCYEEVVNKFTNSGPFVLDALKRTEELLVKDNKADKVVTLYQKAWGRTERPPTRSPEFFTQSNWFRIGRVYVQKLEEGDKGDAAAKVRTEIEQASGLRLTAGS